MEPAGVPDTAHPCESAGRTRGRGGAERLLVVAARLFAERGYGDVSTRALARAAGVNLSAITYHFGGKEGLYRAVIARMLRETEPMRRALIDDIRTGIARAGADRVALAHVAMVFVRWVLECQVLTEVSGGQMQIMLREINQPSFAFEDVIAGHVNPIHDAVCTLIAAAQSAAAEDTTVRILSHAVICQCVIFGLGRRVVQARLGWDTVTPKRFERIAETVGESILIALGLPTRVAQLAHGGRLAKSE
jgi:AcrR family transcriptional regulator